MLIAAREAELGGILVEPPRHINVAGRPRRLVVQRKIFEGGNLTAEAGAHRVHDVFPDEPVGVGEAVGKRADSIN